MSTTEQSTKRFLSRGVKLCMAVFLLATISVQVLYTNHAYADDGGYLWIDATPLYPYPPDYDWGYNPSCPANDTGCFSLPVSYNSKTYGAADPWVYYVRNCTSYVAWKVAQVFPGTNISGWGDASAWASSAPSNEVHPYSSYTPVPGDIAQWVSHDHVAYVYAVNNGVASFYEYNSGYPKDANGNLQWGLFYSGFTSANYPIGHPDNYIHVGNLSPPPPPPLPLRIGTLNTDGHYYVKESSLTGGWTDEAPTGGAVAGYLSGDVIGVIEGDHFYAKEGSLTGGWTDETPTGGASAGAVSDETGTTPLRIGVLEGDHFYVKENSLGAQWTDETPGGGASAGYVSGTRIGVLEGGTFYVKDGSLGAPWTTEDTGISKGMLSGSLIGEITSGGDFKVKQGDLGAQWTDETPGVVASNGMLSDATSNTQLRIGYVNTSGTFWVKEGSLTAGWNNMATVNQGVLSGGLVGALEGNTFFVKQGSLNQGWTNETPYSTQGSLWSL